MTATERAAEYRRVYERRAAAEAALDEAVRSGAQSATFSTAGNSQSVTRISLSELRAEIARLTAKLESYVDPSRSGVRFHKVLPDFR